MKLPARSLFTYAAACIAVLGTSATAQQAAPKGGIQLTFGATVRFAANDNADLDAVSKGTTYSALTNLSFGLLNETSTSRFALDLGGQLRSEDGSGTIKNSFGFEKPSISLAYNHSSAAARFEFTASVLENDLSEATDPLTFATLDGTRRKSLVGTSLDLRDDRPFGFGVFVNAEDVSYGGTGAPLRVGYQRTTAGVRARLDISEVAKLDIKYSNSLYDDDATGPTRTTNELTTALRIDRSFGAATGFLGYTDTVGGSRVTASIGHSFDLPYGEQSFSLGVTRGTTGKSYAIGTIDLSYALPRGKLSVGVDRRVSNNESDDTEELRTDLSFKYSQELSPLAGVSLGLNWSQKERTLAATSIENTSIDLIYNHKLTEDWQISAGYKHKTRRLTGAGRANSNLVFFQIKRQVRVRY